MLKIIPCLLLAVVATAVSAQSAPAGSAAYYSEPGKAGVAQTVKMSVVVTAVNPATRTLTLKTAEGESFDLVAGDEVRNFNQIKVSDEVVVRYVRALTLELRKGGGAIKERADSSNAMRTKEGEKPGVAVGKRTVVLADVIAVSPEQKTITLKGPKGNVVVLDVRNPEQFKVVKVGDQVEAEYVEAVALSVEPAAKAKAKAKAK